MRASKHAPRDPFRVLKRRHCLTEIVKRGTVVLAYDTTRAKTILTIVCAIIIAVLFWLESKGY